MCIAIMYSNVWMTKATFPYHDISKSKGKDVWNTHLSSDSRLRIGISHGSHTMKNNSIHFTSHAHSLALDKHHAIENLILKLMTFLVQ